MSSTRALFCILAVALTACGPDLDDLFSDNPRNGAGGGSGTTTGSTHAAAGQTTNTVTATSTTVATTTTTTISVGPTTSSASGGPTVFCMDTPCEAGDVCCFYTPFAGQDECSSTGECPRPQQDYITLECNGPDDCPGAKCCGGWTDQTGWQYTQCKSDCNQQNEMTMCYGDPSACDPGEDCKASMVLGMGYSYCGQ